MRLIALAGALLFLGLGFLVFRPPAGQGPILRDFEAYYAAGATWAGGRDAYTRDIWHSERNVPGVLSSRDEVLPFVGPPFSLPFWATWARLDYVRAATLWRLVLCLSGGALVVGSLCLAERAVRPLDLAAAVALGASFAPLTSAVALGQVALLSCAAVVGAALALRSKRPLAATLCTFVAALQPNIAVASIALVRRSRWWVIGGAAAVAFGLSVAVLGGFGHLLSYLTVLRAHASAEQFISIQVTPTAVLRALGLSGHIALYLGAFVAIVVLARTIFVLRRGDHDDGARLAIVCAALPLVSFFAHEHDLAIALVPVFVCLRRTRQVAWAAAATATLLIAVDWLGLAQRPEDFTQSVLLALAAACAVLALNPRQLYPWHAGLATVGIAVAAIGTVAARHPLPVWPDALGAAFRAPDLPISALWHLEQVRNGLAAPHLSSGVLRLLSLAGCALLWFACTTALAGSTSGRLDVDV